MKAAFRQRLLATTLLVGAGPLASPALAQTAPAPANPSDTAGSANTQSTTTAPQETTAVPSTNAQGSTVKSSQDIVITGTRIPQPNLTSASPVTVLSSQEIKLQGTTRTEDLINSLPQSFAAQGSNVSNGSTGTATVNLRGLGSSRTLVLVNGRRLMAGDPRVPVADINFIPAPLIKRVDVLTGGASSVYGADAVAGVVNFIMDTNFRGLRIDAQASTFMHSQHGNTDILRANENAGYRPPHGTSINGGSQDIAGAFGAGFDDNRGSIMAYATYRKQDPVLESTRDYSFCSLGANAPQYIAAYGEFYCGGSGTSAAGTFSLFNPITGTRIARYHVAGNQFVPGRQLFNFAPYNFFQRPDERYTLGAFANYEISPGAKPYLEAMFMDDTSVAQIAPSGDFGNTARLNCDNPLLSAQQVAAICRPGLTVTDPLSGAEQAVLIIQRRNVEGGGRQDNTEHADYRLVAGMRGDLLRGLSYDAYYQFGTARFSQTFLNDFSVAKLTRALDVVTDNRAGSPTLGQPVCRSVLNGIDPACVPYNIFQTGGVTPEALAYLQTPGLSRGHVNETIANANVTLEGGEYGLQTPWADRGIGLNAGAEYRKEALDFRVDQEFQSGDLSGQGGPILPVSGSFDVRELFAEVQVPVVSHSFIEDFTLTGGYRYSDYKIADNHVSTNTYKLAAELAPIRDIRARASYNRAVRAPNIVELFAPTSLGLAGGTDPCAGSNPQFTAEQCFNTFRNTNFTLAQVQAIFAACATDPNACIATNPANQYGAFAGGNPNLKPETADTYTAGLVLQPRWIPGFAFTVDYFNIKVKGLIGTYGFTNVLNQCAQTGDPTFCSLVNRDQFGSLTLTAQGFVTLTNVNTGGLRTKGLDINGTYSHRFGKLGTLNVSLVGTYLKALDINPFGQIEFDCAGLYGATCGTPNPKWRHKFRVGLTLPNGLGISGQWRYFSSVKNDTTSNDPDMPAGNDFPANHRLSAKSYFDLALTARLADKFNFRIGANNILDSDPPVAGSDVVVPPFGNGNTFPQVYDALGRFLFAGVTVDF